MRRVLFAMVIVSASLVGAVAPALSQTDGIAPGDLALTFVGPEGGAMAGAPVKVYLLPFGTGEESYPPLLAEGVTDEFGIYFGQLDMQPVVDMFAELGGGDLFNVIIVGVDPTHEWMATWFSVIHTDAGTELTIQAHDLPSDLSDLSTRRLLQVGPVYSGEKLRRVLAKQSDGRQPYSHTCPWYANCQNVNRWPDIITWSNAPGIRSTFNFDAGSTDSHETVTSITAGYPGGSWSLSGAMAEVTSRGSGSGPYERDDVAYNETWEAYYEFDEHANCPRGTCTGYWYEPQDWLGGLREAQAENRPGFDAAHAVLLDVHKYRTDNQTETYTDSFTIQGVANTSVAAYSAHTRIDWYPKGGTPACGNGKKNYLYGSGAAWTQAPVAWTVCHDPI